MYNYLAPSIATPLSGPAIIETQKLEHAINQLKPDETLYHCYYDLEKRDSFKKYEGLLSPVFDTVHIDLDSDDGGLTAWEDTKRLIGFLKEKKCNFELYFSGNKGFHVALHKSAFGLNEPEHSKVLSRKVKEALLFLKKDFNSIDQAIFDSSRKFRAYKSRHEKSGLYKTRLTSIGLDYINFSIKDIRELASRPQNFAYIHPAPSPCIIDTTIYGDIKQPTPTSSVSRGSDEPKKQALQKFKSFSDKKCIEKMLTGDVLPGLNRHDIELCLLVEMRQNGKSLEDAVDQVKQWGEKVYVGEPDRIQDIERQARDIYSKDLTSGYMYDFGCYGLVRKSYCSARCKIYDTLSPAERAQPLDCTKKQSLLNAQSTGLVPPKKSESEVADDILKSIGQDLCKSNSEFFQWSETHWKRIDNERFSSFLYNLCINVHDNKVNNAKVESLYRLVVKKIPAAPENNHFFSNSPDKFNFTDGTAHVQIGENGIPFITMKPHDPKDLLAYCAPFPLYAPHNLPKSGDFLHYLETKKELFGQDGMQAFKQLFGAALIPYAPRIFFLVGDSNTGKSTAAVLLEHLLGQENISSCDPTSEDSFEWETAIGKIANIVRELTKNKTFNDKVLKELRDKRPVRINRKGIKAVQGTLPFLHIYCCNRLPASLEGNTGALNNRITLLTFKEAHVNGFAEIANLGDWLWSQDAGSVLEFAREGLADLIQNKFRYVVTKESEENLIEWQSETDVVKLFCDDVLSGEFELERDFSDNGAIKGVTIFSRFKDWAKDAEHKGMSKGRFYKEMRRIKGVEVRKTNVGKTVFWPRAAEISCAKR